MDISIFRFPWFSPVWYYAPNLDFPTDRMQPGFFLGIAENVGDRFSYEILPVKDYDDIPLYVQIKPVIRSVVRSRTLTDIESPFIELKEGKFIVTNRKGEQIGNDCLSEEELQSYVEVSEEEKPHVSSPSMACNISNTTPIVETVEATSPFVHNNIVEEE